MYRPALSSPRSQELIKGALLENGLTKHLERGQILAIVDCMYPTTVSQGSCVIREGDNASLAYVIEGETFFHFHLSKKYSHLSIGNILQFLVWHTN